MLWVNVAIEVLIAPGVVHVPLLSSVVQVVFDVRTSMGPSDKISLFRKGSREPVCDSMTATHALRSCICSVISLPKFVVFSGSSIYLALAYCMTGKAQSSRSLLLRRFCLLSFAVAAETK